MKKNSRSARTHKHPRKSNRGWIIALIGVVLLFLGIILIFLMVGSGTDNPTILSASDDNTMSQSDGVVLPAHFTDRKITDSASA